MKIKPVMSMFATTEECTKARAEWEKEQAVLAIAGNCGVHCFTDEHVERVLRFAQAIRAAALEEAAQICDGVEGDPWPYADLAEVCAVAIRARDGSSKGNP